MENRQIGLIPEITEYRRLVDAGVLQQPIGLVGVGGNNNMIVTVLVPLVILDNDVVGKSRNLFRTAAELDAVGVIRRQFLYIFTAAAIHGPPFRARVEL